MKSKIHAQLCARLLVHICTRERQARGQGPTLEGSVPTVQSPSCPTLCHPVTVARQALLSLGVSRQEYGGAAISSAQGITTEPLREALEGDPWQIQGIALTNQVRLAMVMLGGGVAVLGWHPYCAL